MKRQILRVVAVGLIGLTNIGVVSAQEAATAEMTGKEVLAKHIEAIGGAEKMKAMTSSTVKGKFMMPAAGIEAPMTGIVAAPQKAIFNIEFPGMGTIRKGTDGDVAWEVSAMSGPRILEGAEKEQFLREADPHADLHPDKYFKSIENIGVKDVDGKKCYQVEFTTKSDKVETRYYDAETFLVTKNEQVTETPMGEINVTSTSSDYKEIDGVMVPHKVEIEMMGQKQIMEFESMEFNKEVPEGSFDIPAEIKELQVADEEGAEAAEEEAAAAN